MSDEPSVPTARLSEHDLIATYFAPLTEDEPGALGLLDDTACVSPDDGTDILVTADALVAGVHFFENDAPADIAHKVLAVNVSDIVAKGGKPQEYILTLCLPGNPEPAWLTSFSSGLGKAQRSFGCRLLGGDTVSTPGPLTLSVTLLGRVAKDGMVRRDGAKPGDLVYVSGNIGDAALGLALRSGDYPRRKWTLNKADRSLLISRYLRPTPRVALGGLLSRYASAAMDVSDGLAGDFEKLCMASAVSGQILVANIPFSIPATYVLREDPEVLTLLVSGGDDYEVLATVPADQAASFEADAKNLGIPVIPIGEIGVAGKRTGLYDSDGTRLALEQSAYEHF